MDSTSENMKNGPQFICQESRGKIPRSYDPDVGKIG